MREIKFRAWDKQNREMQEVNRLNWWSGDISSVGGTLNEWRKDFIVMQYTGLKDKNGKEIYEGDIIKYLNKTGGLTHRYIQIKWQEAKHYVGWNIGSHGNHEVIGNIYENPELLTPTSPL